MLYPEKLCFPDRQRDSIVLMLALVSSKVEENVIKINMLLSKS